LFNKEVPIGEKSPLSVAIDQIGSLKLSHKQNFFSIQYAALDFQEPDNIQYAYKLDGFDKEWQYARKQRVANYTNIPKGEYIFRVKSTNSEGIWVDNERSLPIEVKPSFWQTWIAYVLYLILFGSLMVLCVAILTTIYRLRSDVKLEKKISDMKLRFFTDISHEIRTPLTMITAPVDYLLNDLSTPEDIRKKLSLVSHNTGRMLRLVNQILDFRKIQDQHLRVSETEVGAFVGEICSEFSEMAENQNIDFKYINLALGEKIWVDPDSLEKMVMNLLSNAFKYTPAGKSIRVVVRKDDKNLSIQVTDKGTGIPKELQKQLFTRFATFNAEKDKPSTGIGLSMVKELADKHGARITVESDLNKGSSFTITFQPGFAHFNNDVEVMLSGTSDAPMETDAVPAKPIEPIRSKTATEEKAIRHTVLVVEDDEELRAFLISILESDYTVREASNGAEALRMTAESQPDFVISDIMMPEIDGIQLLQKLREDLNTSHIPIVLLTAKSTIESRLEGLSMGADDYITKPFSVPYFRARIANLIQQRKRLQEIYSSGLTSGMPAFDPKPFQVTSQDETFMESVVKSIEDNIDNSDFTVEELGHSVSMSRSSFFNKVKSLTGLSPVEFIRDIRLKRAAQILVTGQFLIKEVAYMTGFSDARYFGECFKTKFGMTPAEFKKRH
jgi:signal transduction histidine kinase/DNA-binding response OmpR family regulator